MGPHFHILEREEKEFQEVMRAEVGTTSSCTTNSSKIQFLKEFTGTGIIAQCKKKKTKFQTMSIPVHCKFLYRPTSDYILLLPRSWIQVLWWCKLC